MPEIAIVIIKGIALGIGVAAPFGPINTEVVRRALRAGFWPAFVLGLGSVTVDIACAALVLFGVSFKLDQHHTLRETLRFVGGGLLLTLGTILLIQSYRHFRGRIGRNLSDLGKLAMNEGGEGVLSGFFRGIMMTALNPATWGFWFVVFPSMLVQLLPIRHSVPNLQYWWVLLAGITIGAAGWIGLIAGVLGYLKRHSSGLWIAIADLVGALMLLGFGFLVLAYRPG